MLNIADFCDQVFKPPKRHRVIHTVFSSVWYMSQKGLLAGAGLGALLGTMLISSAPISTIVGAFLGAGAGLIAGEICGLLAGLVTVYFFYPLTNPLIYRRVLTGICGFFGYSCAWVGFSRLFRPDAYTMLQGAGNPIIVIPSLIVACIAWYVSSGFAARYSGEKQKNGKRKHEDVYA